MKSLRRTLLVGAAISSVILISPKQAQAAQVSLPPAISSILSAIPGLDAGVISAIESANTYLSMLSNLAQGQIPTIQTVAAAAGQQGGIQIGGYRIGATQGGLKCNATQANGEINLNSAACGNVANAIAGASKGAIDLPVANAIATAQKISAQTRNIQVANDAIATARTNVLGSTAKSITASSSTIANQGAASTNAGSSFARIKAANEIALQGVALQSQSLGIAANQLTTSAQANRINSAQLSIEEAKAQKESVEAQAQARYGNGLTQNATNASALQKAAQKY